MKKWPCLHKPSLEQNEEVAMHSLLLLREKEEVTMPSPSLFSENEEVAMPSPFLFRENEEVSIRITLQRNAIGGRTPQLSLERGMVMG